MYAADSATFTTPFMKLGFCAEGCASIVFPAVMGLSKVTTDFLFFLIYKANELLLLGKTMTAAELERCGLVSAVFPTATFHEELLKHAELLASMQFLLYSLTF
ncbi:enoyl-CoA hydratase/isomerase family protein [Patescibacteria group bacterium]|nr:enoyl-CoA hydratase/isomerase family protein [Patescibacteria group bacterium]